MARAISHERRVFLLALLAGLPAVVFSAFVLFTGNYPLREQWTVGVLILSFWFGAAFTARERVASPLRTIANLLEAIREGDYSIRAKVTKGEDALMEAMQQVNAMAATLHVQRLGALEAATLLRKVMEEIKVAVFAFNDKRQLILVNRAGEHLLAQPAERLLGLDADAVGLGNCLDGEPRQTLTSNFPGASGRWGINRSSFREGGLPHQLLVVTDLTRPLREEELQAWQRLVRVLGHELNNSLTPIKSIAGSLRDLARRKPRPADWEEDLESGLNVIAARSEALSRFMGAYAKLARLPRPVPGTVDVGEWVERVVRLETRMAVSIVRGPKLTIAADGDQLDQLLINILRNAVDAAIEPGGAVRVSWAKSGAMLDVTVEDEGPGLAATTNLFVPFFTTKPGGSGIGLVLSRQIAEAHGGTLTLENRLGAGGCVARLLLPRG
jgi:two-component system nitrogen regulation sensor histidine kinase NtrY